MDHKTFTPPTCHDCGQTTHTLYGLDRGSATIMKKFIRAVKTKGENSVHPAKFLNHSERCNIIRPAKHGLVAKSKHAGEWLITQKGAAFLRGEEVWRYAVQNKTTKHIEGHWKGGGMVTIHNLKDPAAPYWEGADTWLVDGVKTEAGQTALINT